jgi:molecular chaperone HtpG
MTIETQPQIKEFQAETKQVLRLVIHSLYSHKEIFLRELISNASDACEKLRFEALANPALLGSDTLSVTLIPDAAAGTLTVKDNGIGMSQEEVIDNLGTIARSGTKKFLEGLSGDSAKDAQLIGQFGVGFYSAFIVADRVTVLSKRADAAAVRWDSDGEGAYEIQAHDKADRGTEVIMHLREEDKEFLEASRLRQLVRKYSDHLSVPIVLKTGETEETLNRAKAFWTRPKSELKDEDYQAFYKHLTHDSEDARAWAHNKVEGNIEYTSLLYLPKRAPFDLFERDQRGGVQLYVKRVFIMDKAAELLPPWLRFMRGLVDTDDLPLNVSNCYRTIGPRRRSSLRWSGARWTCSKNSPPTNRRNTPNFGRPSVWSSKRASSTTRAKRRALPNFCDFIQPPSPVKLPRLRSRITYRA